MYPGQFGMAFVILGRTVSWRSPLSLSFSSASDLQGRIADMTVSLCEPCPLSVLTRLAQGEVAGWQGGRVFSTRRIEWARALLRNGVLKNLGGGGGRPALAGGSFHWLAQHLFGTE